MAIEYLLANMPMRERVAHAVDAHSRAIAAQKDLTIIPRSSAAQQVEQLAENATWGYFVVPPNTVLEEDPYMEPSLKRGPFLEYTANKDLRTLKQKIALLKGPATAIFEGREERPAQTLGVRFRTQNHTYYSTSLLDILGSQLTYESLRKNATAKQRKEGNLVVDYGDGIKLTILGLYRGEPGKFSAYLEGFPSRTSDKTYRSQYEQLEVLADKPAKGIFTVSSGYPQHRKENRIVWSIFNGHFKNYDADVMLGGAIEREALELGDLVGLRMIETIARKQYGVELNTPIPQFDPAIITLAQTIGDKTIVLNEERKRRKPNKTQWNMLLGMLLASSKRNELLGQE